jgi:hypothetical protein
MSNNTKSLDISQLLLSAQEGVNRLYAGLGKTQAPPAVLQTLEQALVAAKVRSLWGA